MYDDESGEQLGMRRIALATADAHGLYAQFGFAPLPDAGTVDDARDLTAHDAP